MKLLTVFLPLLLAAQTVPDNVTLEKDVIYSQGGRLMMDVARPKAPGAHPAVVAIHGAAGFTEVNRASWQPMLLRLAERGYVAASVDYRLAPRSQFPAALQDVKAAIRFLRANAQRFGIESERIAAVGTQEGGILALLAGLTPGVADFEAGGNRDQSSKITCAVSFDAPADLTRTGPARFPLFLGGSLENAKAAHVLASPLSWVTPQAPPVLSIHYPKDGILPQSQFIDRLKELGAKAELAVLTDADFEKPMMAFLDKHLGIAPPRQVLLIADHGPRGQVVAMEWPSGRELWTVPNRSGHDVQPLPNGHVLYTLGNDRKVIEMDGQHNPVWTYGPEEGLRHPISAQRLPNGNTLIGDAQLGKVIEIDKDRKIVWQYESADLANMRMRNSRRTPAGTTLISVEAAGKIIEVSAAGEIVWSYSADGGPKRRPYRAVRLPNGNTLITLNDPGELVEVNSGGKVIRSIGGEKPEIRMIWCSGFDVLANGNLLISDYLGRRILEVNTATKVVNEVRMPTRTTASIAIAPSE